MPKTVAGSRAEPIAKPSEPRPPPPNLRDYDEARRSFSWEEAREVELDGLPGGRGLNIAHEAVDRHAAGPRADHPAFRWLGGDGGAEELSYGGLRDASSRVANALEHLGLAAGDRIFLLCGRIPDLYVTVLGALKARLVVSPLFAAFGPEPVRTRMSIGKARALLTTPELYDRKVLPVRDDLPDLEHVLLVGGGEGLPEGTVALDGLLEEAAPEYEIPDTDPEDPALLHFTSGTTGRPKGALHVHEAVLAHHMTGKLALDFQPDDVFWCTADPGWVTGTSYGIISPLTNRITSVVDEAEFDGERWYGILQDHGVTVWYTAPTAIRMLMKAGPEVVRRFDLSALRFVASVGEPLNPEAVVWGQEVLGLPIHDNWWQTETGGIMIANYRSMEIRPGSMGRPLPGVEAGIVRREEGGPGDEEEAGPKPGRDGESSPGSEAGPAVELVEEPGVEGELALRRGWPSMFRTYVEEEGRYRGCFAGDWYLTGDLGRRDEDGYFWFVGRADDVIKSAGHLIGPFEVESALLEHPAVAEAAVIGIPDPTVGEVVKAFVALKAGHETSEDLRLDLLGHARKRLGPAVAPREIEFRDDLPKTRSGKIMRRLLKARELGLPEGDTSTLERSGGQEQSSGEAGSSPSPPGSPDDLPDREHALDLLRRMLRIRRFEEKCAQLYAQQKIRGFLHLYIGEEAVAAGALGVLEPDDAVVATYREHGHALVRGVPADTIMAEMFGKVEGCSRGRGGSMHLFDAATRFYGGNAIVGSGLPLAVGLALADRMRGLERVTACFFGEGAVAEGDFHEALNLAALWELPVLFCCENNLYAMGTALERSESETDLVLKATSYEIPAWPVDGMDVVAVEDATRRAADAVRGGGGPYFLEYRTYRFRAHSMFDPELYREKSEVEEWKERDPIPSFADRLREGGIFEEGELSELEEEVAAEVEAAVEFAEAGTLEPIEELTRFVYSEEAEG